MPQSTAAGVDVNGESGARVIDLDSLYASLGHVADRRHARGRRHVLVNVLVCIVLAKLAGQDRLFGISQWVKYRFAELVTLLPDFGRRAPSLNTYRRVVGQAIDIEDFERVVREFFAALPGAGQSRVVAIDGKELRGTIRTGQLHGRHLLGVFLPGEGWMIMQVEVARKENEISAAPRVLKSLDLRGKVVTGDAMFAQRALSLQIDAAGGDYLWTVKDNQLTLRQDIETAFQPEATVKGFSPTPKDTRTAQTVDKGHGREERRTLTVSSDLKDYLTWPAAEQVFKLERQVKRLSDGKISDEVVYGITSLTAQEAGPEQLLTFVRSHWGIENGSHYRRDETLREDWCHLRCGHAPRAMAVINNLIVGLVLHLGRTNLPAARRYFDAHPDAARQLVLQTLT